MSSAVQPLLIVVGAFVSIVAAMCGVVSSCSLFLNALINGVDKLRERVTGVASKVSDNPRVFIVLLLVVLVSLLGLLFVLETDAMLDAVDVFNSYVVRPTCEVIVKLVLIPIRDIVSGAFHFWNVGIRYMYDECLVVFAYDVRDWATRIVNDYEAFLPVFNSGNGDVVTASISGIFLWANVVGRMLASLAELPFMLWSAIECMTWVWTKPHPLWIEPVATVEVGYRTPQAYYPVLESYSTPSFNEPPHYYGASGNSQWPDPTTLSFERPPEYDNIDFDDIQSTGGVIGKRAFEFNPRYGAFDVLPTSGFFRYVRRVVVGFQQILIEGLRTLFLIIRLLRRPALDDLWEALIVDVNSSLSLWRMVCDTFARLAPVSWIAVMMPADPQCDGLDVPQTSRIRFAVEYATYKTFRVIGAFLRSLTLLLYDALTTRKRGTPVVDLFMDWVQQRPMQCGNSLICQLVSHVWTGLNLFKRSWHFCDTADSSGAAYVGSAGQLDYLLYCPMFPGHHVPRCPRWDGVSFATLSDTTRIAHYELIVNAAFDFLYIFQYLSDFIKILTCHNSGGPVSVPIIKDLPLTLLRVQRVVVRIVDILASIVYLVLSVPCVGDDSGLVFEFFMRILRWIIVDEFLNRLLPLIIAAITQIDCVRGQNIFTCIITQLSIIDPTGAIEVFCRVIHAIMSFIDAVYTIIRAIVKVFGKVINAIGKVVKTIVNAIKRFFKKVKESFDSDADATTWKDVNSQDPGDANGETVNVASFDKPDIGLLMPCDWDDLQAALNASGPITRKRADADVDADESSLDDIDEAMYSRMMEAAMKSMRQRTSTAKPDVFLPDPPADDAQLKQLLKQVSSADNDAQKEQLVVDYVSDKMSDLMSSDKFDDKNLLFASMLASDARTAFRAAQRCVIGAHSLNVASLGDVELATHDDYILDAPSEYALCVDTLTDMLGDNTTVLDDTCIAARCAQLAYACMYEHTSQHARRMFVDTEGENLVLDSYAVAPLLWSANQIAWLAEVGTCPNANPTLAASPSVADSAFRSVLSVLTFGFDLLARLQYIGRHYARSYHTCLDEATRFANSSVHMPSGALIVAAYVNCLEEPYVSPDARWSPPDVNSSAKLAFAAYMGAGEQRLEPTTSCYSTLMSRGFLFNTPAEDNSTPDTTLVLYRVCAMAHAYGTRATLAAWRAADGFAPRGTHLWTAEATTQRATQRTPVMWRPLGGMRSVDDYMVLWQAPVSIMRSAEFLTTNMGQFVSNKLDWLSDAATTFFVFARTTLYRALMAVVRFVVNDMHAGLVSVAHLVRTWADTYDKLIEPRFNSPAERSAFLRLDGEAKKAEASRMYTDMLDALDELNQKHLHTHGRLITHDARRLLHEKQGGIGADFDRAQDAKWTSVLARAAAAYDEQVAYANSTVDGGGGVAMSSRKRDAAPAVRPYSAHRGAETARRRVSAANLDARFVRRSSRSMAADDTEPHETYVGRDEHGNDMYVIDLDKLNAQRAARAVKGESRDAYVRMFASRLYWPLHGGHAQRAHASARPLSARGTPTQRHVPLDDAGQHTELAQLVPIDFDARRAGRDPSIVTVRARVDISEDVVRTAGTRSASWSYSPYKNIELDTLSRALRTFLNSTLERHAAAATQSVEEDAADTRRAIQLIDRVRFPHLPAALGQLPSTSNSSSLLALYAQAAQLHETNVDKLGYMLAERVRSPPVSAADVGSVLGAVSRIINRRVRLGDLPPVQAMAMLLDALATNDHDRLAAWLDGSLGYVTGVGFVPRLAYEQYMSAVDGERERQIVPYTHGFGYVYKKAPLFLAVPEPVDAGASAAPTANKLHARIEATTRRHYADRMYAMLHAHGHLDTLLRDGDERTWRELERIAPHVHSTVWPARQVDVEQVRHLMHTTRHEQRTDEQRAQLKFAARVVARSTSADSTLLTKLLDALIYIVQLFYLDDVGLFVYDFFHSMWIVLSNIANELRAATPSEVFNALFGDYVCSVPNDFAYDGTGTYTIGCLVIGFLPERALSFIDVWPTNARNGDLVLSDEAYVNGNSTCQGIVFRPDAVCNLPEDYTGAPVDDDDDGDDDDADDDGDVYTLADSDDDGDDDDCDDYVAWHQMITTFKPVCFVSKGAASIDPLCRGLMSNFSNWPEPGCGSPPNTMDQLDPATAVYFAALQYHPRCPHTPYCSKEYNSCFDSGYGFDPVRIIQVYYAQLSSAWDEILDITNSYTALVVWVFCVEMVGLVSLPKACCSFRVLFVLIMASMLAYGLIVESQTFLYPALLYAALHVLWLPGAVAFMVFMTVRVGIYNFIDLYMRLTDTQNIDPDLLRFSLPPLFEFAANLVKLLGDLPCFVPYLCDIATPTTLADRWPLFDTIEASLRLFESSQPTSFDVMCSVFGLWAVIATVALLIVFAYLVNIFGGIIFAIVGVLLALLNLVFVVSIYTFVILFFVTSLVFYCIKSALVSDADDADDAGAVDEVVTFDDDVNDVERARVATSADDTGTLISAARSLTNSLRRRHHTPDASLVNT